MLRVIFQNEPEKVDESASLFICIQMEQLSSLVAPDELSTMFT